MSPFQIEALDLRAAEAQSRLAELRAERAFVLGTEVGKIDAYVADLELEIEIWRRLYVTAAVAEIASLRAELYGAQLG